jgi:hypothetical protein
MADEAITELEVCYDRYTRLNPVIESLKQIHEKPDFPSSKLNDFADRINVAAVECAKTHRCGRFCRWFESHLRNNLAWAAELKDGSLMNSMTSAWFSLFFCMHQTPDEFCEIIKDEKYDKYSDKKSLSLSCSKSNILRIDDFYDSINDVLKDCSKVGKAICSEIVNKIDLFKRYTPKVDELLQKLAEIAKNNKDITPQFCAAVASLSKNSPESGINIFDQFLFAVNQDPMANAMHLLDFVKATHTLFKEPHRKKIGRLLYDWHKNGNRNQKRWIRWLQKSIIPFLRCEIKFFRPNRVAVKNCRVILHDSPENDIFIAEVIDVSGGGDNYPSFGRGIHFRRPKWEFYRAKFIARIENLFGTSIENSILQSNQIGLDTPRFFEDPKVTIEIPGGTKIPCSSYSVRAYPPETDSEDSGAVIFLNNDDKEFALWKKYVIENGIEV